MEKPNGQPRISIIAALGTNTFAIGRDNKLLWHIPDDLKHFKKITGKSPIIMGRKTFESIGKRLPGFQPSSRQNFIVTRNQSFEAPGCHICYSFEEAVRKASKTYSGRREIFIIGGGELYREAFPYTSNLYLTFIEDDKPGDTFFPQFDAEDLVAEPVILGQSKTQDGVKYNFVKLEKRNKAFPWAENKIHVLSKIDFSLLPASSRKYRKRNSR